MQLVFFDPHMWHRAVLNGDCFVDQSFIEAYKDYQVQLAFAILAMNITGTLQRTGNYNNSAVNALIVVGVMVLTMGLDLGMSFEQIKSEIRRVFVDILNLPIEIILVFEQFSGDLKAFIELIRNKYFNSGYSYAKNNPEIVVDTDLLREYAKQLNLVNNKLKNIDYMIDRLYRKVGLLDAFNLINSDLRICYSMTLKQCESYLNDVGMEFDEVEDQILKM